MARIRMKFGMTLVHAETNDAPTARAFLRKLPCTIHVSGTGMDFCGRIPFSLPYEQEQVHRGWTNGDVNYNPGGGWFAVLYDGAERSQRYGDQVTMARVDEADLPALRALDGSFDARIELAG